MSSIMLIIRNNFLNDLLETSVAGIYNFPEYYDDDDTYEKYGDLIVRPEGPLVPSDYYSQSKIEMEKYLRDHFQNYLVFRIAGVLPTSNDLSQGLIGAMFDLHTDVRMEMIIDRAAAFGLIHGVHHLVENKSAVKGCALYWAAEIKTAAK